MSISEKAETEVNFKAIKPNPQNKEKQSFDEFKTNMMNSFKGKLYIPPEIIPIGKRWMWASINPASDRDYQMELMMKGWITVKKSMHPYFNITTEKNKNRQDSDVVINHGQILMEIDEYICQYHERANHELAVRGAATAGSKPNYIPTPGLFERAEGKVTQYSNERRPIRNDDF
jgi:hypothetical protein